MVGENVEGGVYPTRKALEIANELELDLVEISPNATPPVCKVIDYKKFLYEQKKRDKELKDLYKQYVGEYEDLRNLSVDELLLYAKEQWDENERIDRIDMVAELLYAEASYKGNPLRSLLQEKAYALFYYVEAHGTTFSIDRQQKMEAMRHELGNLLSDNC